jgi:hypothetical protein
MLSSLCKVLLPRPMANYLVVTFRDRLQLESAYADLERQDFPLHRVSLIGSGHKTLAETGLYDPSQSARRQMGQMLVWLVPFGFLAGFSFNLVTEITIFQFLDPWGNRLLGGLFGAIAAAMGSFTVGGGAQLLLAGQERIPFAERLRAGKYLLAIAGSEALVRQANQILRSLPSEGWQAYEAPDPQPNLARG